MTLPLTTFRSGRPDWVAMDAMAGIIYEAIAQPFTTDLESDPVPVWPWATVQISGAAGVADLDVSLKFWADAAKSRLDGTYPITCLANGVYHASFPTMSPYMTVLVHQVVPAVNNTVWVHALLSGLPWTQLNDKEAGSLLLKNSNINAGAGSALTSTITWDGDVDFTYYSPSPSSDIAVYNQRLDGLQFHRFKDLARPAGPLNLRFRSLPSPLHVVVTNNDAVARLYTYNLVPVIG